MKLSTSAALFLAAAATTTSSTRAFAPSDGRVVKSASSSFGHRKISTARYFLDTSGGDRSNSPEVKNPVKDIQSYLPQPEPVEVSNISGTCLVSGKVSPELFYLLNNEDSAFEFDKIVSISPDISGMKKQLLTRQARYTGLLSKLDYSTGSLLPTSELLESASSWIAVVDSLSDLKMIAQCAGQVDNVAVLYMAPSNDGIEAASYALKEANPNASLVIVDQTALVEQPINEDFEETKAPPTIMFYQEYDASTVDETDEELISNPAFMQEEAIRMVTECLQLAASNGKTISLKIVENDTQSETSASQSSEKLFPKLTKGLREAGYERPQEIDYMLRLGVPDYLSAIQGFEKENPTAKDGVVHTNAWWEDPEFQKLVKQSSLRKDELIAANRERETRLVAAAEEEKFA